MAIATSEDGGVHPWAQRLIDATPRPLRSPVELTVRTAVDAADDRVVGLSAEVAFFAILSLPPLLLTIVAALGFLPGDQAQQFVTALVAAAERVFTDSTVDQLIAPTARAVVDSPRTDVLSIGFVIALVSASRAVRAVLTAVAIAYDLDDRRSRWRHRVLSLLITFALFLVVPVLVPLMLSGPDFGRWLARSDVVPTAVSASWPLIYWFGVGVVAVLGATVLLHLGAPWWTPLRRDLPGAVLAVAVWLASSAALRLYTEQAFRDERIYQLLAGPLALLVWLYLIAFGLLLGGELNAELERLHPSPEQQRLPAPERLTRRLLDSSAGARLTEALRPPDVAGSDNGSASSHTGDRGS